MSRDWKTYEVVSLGMVLLLLIASSQIVPKYQDLSASEQVSVVLGLLGAVGTLSLAIATFYSIHQTNKNFELRRKDQEKPLVEDELRGVIQPAIAALEYNTDELEDDLHAFRWLYVDGASGEYGPLNQPKSVRDRANLVGLRRLAAEDRMLYGKLEMLDGLIDDLGTTATEIEREVEPEIEEYLRSQGINTVDVKLRVLIDALMRNKDGFKESHELHDIWKEHEKQLHCILRYTSDEEINDLEAGVRVYRDRAYETLRRLRERKVNLQEEYGISSEDISADIDFPEGV